MTVVALGEIADRIDYGVTASAEREPVGPKMLRITDIQDDAVDWSVVPYCPAVTKGVQTRVLAAGDIVFARTGATTGKSFHIEECPVGTVFASYLIRLRLRSDCADPRYVSHFFRTPAYWQQISSASEGVAQPGVNATKLGNLMVPLPPIEEQRRIAAVLDAADALRARRRHALATLDTLEESVFVSMFASKAEQTVCLGEVADIQGGLQVTSKRKTNPIEVPYLRVANVQRGSLDLSEIKMIRVTQNELDRTQLTEGDLLVVEGHGNKDEIGRVGIWNGSIDRCVHQNHLIRVRCNESALRPRFAAAFLNSWVGRRALLRAANTTSGLNTISTGDVRAVEIPLPGVVAQQSFVETAIAADSRRAIMTTSLKKLDLLFAALQQRAFRGEL